MKMLVSSTRLRSREENLKMKSVMSHLPQLMMTALDGALFLLILEYAPIPQVL